MSLPASTARVHIVAHVPPGTGPLYLTGNTRQLGDWKPDAIPLEGEGTRRDAWLLVPIGTRIEFKFTAGDWEHEALDGSGGLPANHVLEVSGDAGYEATITGFALPYNEEFAHEFADDDDMGKALTLTSPRDWQVVQRRAPSQGIVDVQGVVRARCAEVHVFVTSPDGRVLVEKRVAVQPAPGGGSFRTRVELPAGGWYRVRVEVPEQRLAVGVDHVGVGEVFVGAGQSNSTNCGQFRTRQQSAMVTSFGGRIWRPADDPQPGPHDKSTGGSFWPAFGDALHARLGVPIGVATTGHSGTSIRQWESGGELFLHTLERLRQLGSTGFRAVLWHQGESDWDMPAEEYCRRLRELVTALREQAGWSFPWMLAKASYHSPQQPCWENVRAAHQQLWDEGFALRGPDTDILTGDHRDYESTGIHFSPKGLKAHGEMWARCVGEWLETGSGRET